MKLQNLQTFHFNQIVYSIKEHSHYTQYHKDVLLTNHPKKTTESFRRHDVFTKSDTVENSRAHFVESCDH